MLETSDRFGFDDFGFLIFMGQYFLKFVSFCLRKIVSRAQIATLFFQKCSQFQVPALSVTEKAIAENLRPHYDLSC